MTTPMETIINILDEMRVGTPETEVPLEYVSSGKNHHYKQMKLLIGDYLEKAIDKASRRASNKARDLIQQHVGEATHWIGDDEKLKSLTTLYLSKYRNKYSLLGWKRFVVQNKAMENSAINTEFNKVFDWGNVDVGNLILEAAQKHHTRCDTIYDSFNNGQNSQFMEQIVDYDVDISFLINFVGNYYGKESANEVARRYAALAQGELDTLRRTIEDLKAEAEERNGTDA